LLLLALAGTARSQPAPAPLVLLDVPFISQSEALCGGAAAAMVLRFWGARGLTAETFAHLVDESAAGIRTDALVNDLRGRGWNAAGLRGTGELATGELANGRPVLALIEDRPGTYHYVVIIAATSKAIVFHDPARAPHRVMGRVEFDRRWDAAGRWMAVVLPGHRGLEAPPAGGPEGVAPAGAAGPVRSGGFPTELRGDMPSSCDRLLADGIRLAQENDLSGAERTLTQSLSCGGAAPLRELAGVRVLQRRWADVEALASAAVAEDAADAHAWRLLATSRFVQDNPSGALEAWNHIGEPRIDLVSITGLTRTRHRPVERLIGLVPGEVLNVEGLARARRRLSDLPAAQRTRLDYAPVPSGLAEVRASVAERPLAPQGMWGVAAIAASAAARRELEWSAGAISGGGERVTGAWRFWPGRPRLAFALDAPAPWGGVVGVGAFAERQPFDPPAVRDSERRGVRLSAGTWMWSRVRAEVHGGVERWTGMGALGLTGAAVRVVTHDDRVDLRLDLSAWAGEARFVTTFAAFVFRSSTARTGRVYIARAGAGAAGGQTPPDLWFAGDTGRARPVLLRAHPLVADGRFRLEQLGRRITYASAEAQHWWPARGGLRVGAAVFADSARTSGRVPGGARADVDAGAGARLAIPGVTGLFRLDLAKGLRDGRTALSFVYEP
jgi:hypothetical protein